MRIYKTFTEAIPEIKRDVVEMGIKCHPNTYQDKNIAENPDFETLELQNYIYTVVEPEAEQLMTSLPWADSEWLERMRGIAGDPLNPGYAWTLREEVWREFLVDERFSYTYGERFANHLQVKKIIQRIKEDPDSRQLFISVWDISDIEKLGGISRVPCSLGYQIQIRKGALNITYLQRSCDLATHFVNDVWMAHQLQKYLCLATGWELGTFTHWVGSLHLFRRDAQGVF